MADDWISLAEAYKIMLAVEDDDLLVQKLLIPVLWDGSLPCISSRAFTNDKLISETSIVTKNEWPLEENPILYDWSRSRSVLPRGFYKPSQNFSGVHYERTEYFGVRVSFSALKTIFPKSSKVVFIEDKTITATGLPGRPSAKNYIAAEIERRAALGERYKTVTDWSVVLRDWYRDNYKDGAPSATAKTIANKFRSRLKELLSR